MRPIYKYPEEARESIRTGAQQQSAIKAAADPMLRDIEIKSGMAPGANVLQANLYEGAGLAGQDAYLTALRSKLPGYVNAYRAYLEKEKKDAAGSGAGSGGLPPMGNYMPTMPPATSYLPTLTLPEALKGVPYVPSYFGGVPMGSDYGYYTLPPASRLARRMATTRGGKAMVE